MNERTEGRTDGGTDGRTDGQTNERTNEHVCHVLSIDNMQHYAKNQANKNDKILRESKKTLFPSTFLAFLAGKFFSKIELHQSGNYLRTETKKHNEKLSKKSRKSRNLAISENFRIPKSFLLNIKPC